MEYYVKICKKIWQKYKNIFVQINLIKKEGERRGYITICINEIWANLWKHKDAKHEV